MSDSSSWRYCPRCGEHKGPKAFYRDGKPRPDRVVNRRLWCRDCYRAQMRSRYADRAQFITDYKMDRGCVDCGFNAHAQALEFDHLPGVVKVADITKMVGRACYTLDDIKAEIAKCEVVCANCHRIRTFGREFGNRNWDLQVDAHAEPEGCRPEQLTFEI